MPLADDDLLSVSEVAALLGLSRSTVGQAVAAGTLPAQQVGHQRCIRRGDAEAYRQRRGNRLGKSGRTPGLNPPKRAT